MTKQNRNQGSCADGDVCDDCRREEMGEEEESPDFLNALFNDCIFMPRSDEAQIPLAVVVCDGVAHVGGLIDFRDNGAICLINPLKYVEMVDNRMKTIVGGLVRPYAQLGLPPIIFLRASALVTLKASNPKDVSFAGAYNESYKRYAAEDIGIELPPSGTVVGRA